MPFRVQSVEKLPRRDIRVDGVFDLETAKMVNFVMGGLIIRKERSDGTRYDFHHFGPGEEEQLARFIIESGLCIWAHFGGGFDFKWLLDWIVLLYPGKFVDLFVANSRIIMLKVGKTKLYDSWALTMLSLKKLTKGMGVEKQELSLPCDCERYCGGWCSMDPFMAAPLYRRVSEYMEVDCRSLFEAMDKLRGFAEENDLDLGATIGSAAWRNAKRFLGLPDAKWTDDEYDYIRLGYFGGRVQLLRHGLVSEAWYYDVNSMYPAMLANVPMPVGARYSGDGGMASRAYASGLDGVFTAIVKVPETFLPPLPIRYVKKAAKAIAYPTGLFKGTWTGLEMRAAEEDGTHVLSILRGEWWERSEVIYRPWIEKIFAIREKFGKNSPLGMFAKGYGNSFSGKCAARPDRFHYEIGGVIQACYCRCVVCGRQQKGSTSVSVLTGREEAPCRCSDGFTLIECRCGASHMLGEFVSATPYRKIDECAHVHHAAHLTAAARVAWRHKATSMGAKNTVYGDTDSVISTGPYDGSSNRLGGWKVENMQSIEIAEGHSVDVPDPIRNFFGYAPKVYSYETAKGQESRAKGVTLETIPKVGHVIWSSDKSAILTLPVDPDAGRLVHPIDSSVAYTKTIVSGFRAGAAHNKFFRAEKLTRTLSRRMGDRVLDEKLPDGTQLTRAKTIEEIELEGPVIQAKHLR